MDNKYKIKRLYNVEIYINKIVNSLSSLYSLFSWKSYDKSKNI